MKYIVALLLAITFAPGAHAESCKPAGKEYIHAFEQRGNSATSNWAVWWWCDSKTYRWAAIIPEDYTSDKIVAFNAWVYGLDADWVNRPPSRSADDPLMKSLADAAYAFASADTNRPPAAVWVVAKNGKYADRPTYPVSFEGVRGKTSDGRAPVGDLCDCRSSIVEGKTTYCPRAAKLISATTTTSVPPPARKPMSVAVCTPNP